MIIMGTKSKTQRNDKIVDRFEYEPYDNYTYYLLGRDGWLKGFKMS